MAQGAHQQVAVFLGIGHGLLDGLQGIGVGHHGLQFAARAAGFKHVAFEVFGRRISWQKRAGFSGLSACFINPENAVFHSV